MKIQKHPPKITGIVVIVAISLVFILIAYFVSPTNSHYNPENTQGTKDSYASTHVVTIIPDKTSPMDKTTQPYTTAEKENFVAARSDLAAQWAMAHYTFLGLIVGLIGIILIAMTYYQSKQAAFFTEQALAETKANSKRELRAYLGTHIVALNLKDTAGIPTIHIRFENRGMSPAMGISCHVIGMGADEIIERRASIQPNDIEEIEWPLEDIDMKIKGEEEYFEIRIAYSDIFNGKRWLRADFFVIPEFDFPTTKAVSNKLNLGTSTFSPIANPGHVRERKIQFRYYTDDLQVEAKQYAEDNQSS